MGSGVGTCTGASSAMPVFYPSRTAHIVGAQKLAFLVGSGIIAVRVSSSPTPTSPRFYFTEIKSASILLQVMFPNSEDFPT